MFTFNIRFFYLSVILFITEVLIAVFINDSFIRPYFGDFLVVILCYCLVKTFLKSPVWKVALGVLLFSYLIETLQYLHIVNKLGLENNVVARTVIGIGFDWFDLLAYTLGVITVYILEKCIVIKQNHNLSS